MREIQYRGRSLRTKKFVYGDYISRWRGEEKGTEHYIIEHPFGRGSGREVMHRIDPTTLSESTGIEDREHKMIFEGDIIRVYYLSKTVKSPDSKKSSMRTVRWGTTDHGVGFNLSIADRYFFEVVDNVHDAALKEATI